MQIPFTYYDTRNKQDRRPLGAFTKMGELERACAEIIKRVNGDACVIHCRNGQHRWFNLRPSNPGANGLAEALLSGEWIEADEQETAVRRKQDEEEALAVKAAALATNKDLTKQLAEAFVTTLGEKNEKKAKKE